MKKDKQLVIVFLIIVFGIFICIPSKYVLVKLGITSINRDNIKEYNIINSNNILDKLNNVIGKLENSIENTITNYFPFYNELNGIYQNINFYTNKIIYEDIPIKTNSDGEYIFYDKENEFYYLGIKYTEEELDERINKQIDFFNNLSKNIELYIYIPTRYELTTLKEDNLNSYLDKFSNSLNDNINLSIMDIKDIKTYKEYFYKTDHHWTINGALEGYYSIMNMLSEEPINNLNIIENKEKKYYGSLAKSSLNDIVYDYISDIDLKLDYDVYVNGSTDELFKPRKIRLDRSYKYYDYYVSYFNGQYGNVVYDYHNIDKENILILGDSYTWQIDYLIASSFNKTHVINLRYDEYKNNTFNLTEYIKNNDISKVLFLYDGGSILFDQYDYNFIGRVR